MKAVLKEIAGFGAAHCFRRTSPSRWADIFVRLINVATQHMLREEKLQCLFELENRLYRLEGEASREYGNGLHSKHRHTSYHNYFIDNLNPVERVLDIGSGNGFLSYMMATKVPHVHVVGIELNESNMSCAQDRYQNPNLCFIHGDALTDLPEGGFDVVTLSNVLEHIEHRVDFLKKILKLINPKRLIIRVPLFERDWRVPLKKELGVEYRLDPTHFIEYTHESYLEELHQAGLTAVDMEFRWGEIWSVVKPVRGDNI